MDENKTSEGASQKGAGENNGAGIQPKATTLVDDANAAAERLEKASERYSELIRQEQELQARRALGGRTEGASQDNKPKEETPAEYRKRIEADIKSGKLR